MNKMSDDDKENLPQKQKPSFHWLFFICTIIQTYFFSSGLGYYLDSQVKTDLSAEQKSDDDFTIFFILYALITGGMIWIGFLSQKKGIKSITQLYDDYNQIKGRPVHFKMSIQCYHEDRDTQGSTKVVTHRASQTVQVLQCKDLSGFLSLKVKHPQYFDNPFVYITFNKPQYEFINSSDQNVIKAKFDQFVRRNERDQHQQKECDIQYQDQDKKFIEYKYITDKVTQEQCQIVFYIGILSTCACLGWAFWLLLEGFVDRRKIKIQKKVRLSK